MHVKKHTVLSCLVSLIYCILVSSDYINFNFLPQVSYIFSDTSFKEKLYILEEMLSVLHPHTIRSFLMLPIYAFAALTSIDIDNAFGLFVVINTLLTYYFVTKIVQGSFSTNSIILFTFFSLVLLMNGRVSFAILGNSLILYSLYRKHYLKDISLVSFILFILIGLLNCSVTSGASFVSILLLMAFYTFWLLKDLPKLNLNILLTFIITIFLVFYILQDFLLVYYEKNVMFYDGSLVKMLSHGLGQYLNSFFLIGLLPLILTITLMVFLLKKYPIFILPISLIISSLAVGLFGISSLVSGISGYILFICLYAKKYYKKQYYT